MVEGGAPPVKTAKQLEKEAKKAAEKAAKLEKLAAKQAKKNEAPVKDQSEKKDKKPKKEEKTSAVYTSLTKPGEKKDTKVFPLTSMNIITKSILLYISVPSP